MFHLEGTLEDGIEPVFLKPTLADKDNQDAILVSVDVDKFVPDDATATPNGGHSRNTELEHL